MATVPELNPAGVAQLGSRLAANVAPAVVASITRLRRRRELLSAQDPELRDLLRVLRRVGYLPPPGSTLLDLERLLVRAGATGVASHVAQVRRRRFAREGAPLGGRRARWALRRALHGSALRRASF
jgi:hypothetical protein